MTTMQFLHLSGIQDASTMEHVASMLKAEGGLCFNFAMLSLGVGSIPFCLTLWKKQLCPSWMALLGLIGYICLIASAVLDMFGADAVVTGSLFAPGGLFEIIFPIQLIVNGMGEEEKDKKEK
eukprot:TRINITY_DN2849_c0_g1_i1.p3 TRINITY_DN2849_c0_g1~~TRINITY_DN2849_c0_g1_i1.p3  ORF type:complete len:122 (-),score=49.88 TRINITY_DN2849_c0_g1_i1:430-795(-)